MKAVKFFLAINLMVLNVGVIAQKGNYHLSRNLIDAIEQQTRTLTGLPGQNYWQNHASYTMEAEFIPDENLVTGHAEIAYFNESPDTLKYLVFNLYQDIFRKGNSRDWDLGMDAVNEGTVIHEIQLQGERYVAADKKWSVQGTKLLLPLKTPLSPKESVIVEINWEVSISAKRPVRMGQYSDSSFFVAYWYPQIAVYDDIDGWDRINYNGSVESYNDFNNYEVSVTVPDGWIVWATGMLENAKSVFTKEIAQKIEAAGSSETIVSIISQQDYTNDAVFKKAEKYTYTFAAQAVPDFSFAVARGFNWDASGLEVRAGSKQKVLISAVYPKKSYSGKRVAAYARQSIDYMSRYEPGLAFPYPQMTTFLNGRKSGGMETPMMANNGDPAIPAQAFGLTFHEIAHSYMPFYMGTNEKKYAWMDEGWATIWPQVMVDSLFPDYGYLEGMVYTYERIAGFENDIPPMIPNQMLAADYGSLRLGSYTRPAFAYAFLQDALGAAAFKEALHFYMVNWAGKHPLPTDFFKSFEMVAGRDLSWFFHPWFYDNAYPDLSLRKITADNQIVVENNGGLPLPVCLEVFYDDGTQQLICESTSIWEANADRCLIAFDKNKTIKEVVLGHGQIPDVNPENNRIILADQ
ncbi:MAG: M1 family metallopeptidase [Bacteroidetes bacterium]|nr:M1 family metallopeptidase [Bacteroidota bacterium]MBU1579156.1 M1 family metallopeptidase [Bacteroidota bacterium]